MPLLAHKDSRYAATTLLAGPAEWTGLCVERRQLGPGKQNCVRSQCTGLIQILGGRAVLRHRGSGRLLEAIAQPGMCWLVPAQMRDALLELDGPVECLLVFLPARLLEDSVLAGYGVDPHHTQLAYAGGVSDAVLTQIGSSLNRLLDHPMEPVDHILADGLRRSLAAHLLGNYAVGRSPTPMPGPSLDAKRLSRVLDFIDARLGADIALEDLAREACLSSFHFSRLFHQATGSPPHRYVTERRIRVARDMLATGRSSMAEIAFDIGFGSQANFARTFRKFTGVTPSQYRASQQSL